MRYVIVIFTIACFLIWDGWFNNGIYADRLLRQFLGLLSYLGL